MYTHGIIVHLKLEIIKNRIFYPFLFFLFGIFIFTAFEDNLNRPGLEESILPDELTIELPASLSQEVTAKKTQPSNQ
jgi:hypothetical protein